jgi:O-antigen ligase
MSFDRTKWHRLTTTSALALSVAALPFSVALCHLGLIILCLNWIIEGKWKSKWEMLKKKPAVLLFVLFFVLHLIGLIYSEDKANGLFNVEKKMAFLFLPLVIATSQIDSSQLTSLLKYFVFTVTVAAIICIIVAGYHSLWPNSPPVSNFDSITSEELKSVNPEAISSWSYFSYQSLSSVIGMHPTYLSVYVLFSIAILFYFYVQEMNTTIFINRKYALILLFFLSFFLLSLSSRITIIGYFLLCFSAVIWFFNSKIAWLFFSGIIITIILFIFINPVTHYRFIQEFQRSNYSISSNVVYNQSTTIRLSLWWTGLHALKENNFIIGVGTGDTMEVMRNTGIKYGITNILNSHDPHNQFLYTALSLGVFGLTVLLACLLFPFFLKDPINNFLYIAFLGIVFLICLTESFFELQKGIVFFSIFNSLFVFHFESSKVQCLKFSHV